MRIAVMLRVLSCALALATSLGAAAATVVLEHELQPPWRHFLVRRDDGGALDARFGDRGRVVVDAMSPRSVVTDARGRYLVVGSTLGAASRPVLMRYLANGELDPTWGRDGASIEPPVEGTAHAVASIVLADGRALVLGQLDGVDARAALWRVDTAGRFEPRWLALTGLPAAEALSLVGAGSDTVMIGVKQGNVVEGHIFSFSTPLAVPERLVQQALPEGWSQSPALVRTGAGWRWVDVDEPAGEALKAVAVDDTSQPLWSWQDPYVPAPEPAPRTATPSLGGALFNPLAARRPELPPRTSLEPWYLGAESADLTMASATLLAALYLVTRLLRRAWNG